MYKNILFAALVSALAAAANVSNRSRSTCRRASVGLADLTPAGWRLVPRPGMDQRRAAEFLERDLDALHLDFRVLQARCGHRLFQATFLGHVAAGAARARHVHGLLGAAFGALRGHAGEVVEARAAGDGAVQRFP